MGMGRMNRQAFLARLGLGFLGTLFARSASATTDHLPGAPDTADAVPAEPVTIEDTIASQIYDAIAARAVEARDAGDEVAWLPWSIQ